MRKAFCQLSVVSCQILLLLGTALAQEDNYRFTLDFGYRWKANFRGSEDLYRSQLDYGEGPKLFGGDFFLAEPAGSNRFFDRLQLTMHSWGGEPYNVARGRASKEGVYEFQFDYQNVQYFNAIPFFANPFFEQGKLQTQHKYDISHRFAGVQLAFSPGKRLSPFFRYDRTGRQGLARTTLAAEGDEFLLVSNADTHSNDFRGGVRLNLARFSLLLEQGVRRYRDQTSFDSAGFQIGNSTRPVFGRDITLNRFVGKNDVDVSIPFSNVVAAYQPFTSLALRGKVSYSIADLDSAILDETAGTFFSRPLAAFFSGRQQQTVASSKKPTLFADFTAEWQPFERLRVTERVGTRRLHVSGSALTNATFLKVEPILEQGIIDQVETATPFDTFLSMDQDTQEVQGFFYFTPKFLFRMGHRYERKRVELGEETFSLDRNVLISGLAYEFSLRNRIAAEYEFGRTSRPILRLDPVDFHRVRVRGRSSPFEALEVQGSMTLFDNEDELESVDFSSRHRDYALQFGYTPLQRLSVNASYERSSIRSSVLFIIPQTFLTDRSVFRERGDYGTLFLSFRLPRDSSLDLGYSVWGTTGNFPVTYHQPFARVEISLSQRFSIYGQWNHYDYNEKLALFPQDYRTHLVVLGFRSKLDGLLKF